MSENEILQQFRFAMQAAGIVPPTEIIADGERHRCGTEKKPKGTDATYILHLDGVPAGGFQNWQGGDWHNWKADRKLEFTPEENAAYRARVKAMEEDRKREDAARKQEAQKRAVSIWEQSAMCDSHEYLTRKGVSAHGVKSYKDALVVPMRDASGTLHSLQLISQDGEKRFLTGGRKSGCYFSIGKVKPGGVLCIAEGYATGASIHEATGHAVAVAFDAGNLAPVAKALREKMPDVQMVLCADDDYRTDGNPGVTKARKAALTVGGVVAIPDFGDARPENATDFNDLHQHLGLEAVQRCIDRALSPEQEHESTAENPTPITEPIEPTNESIDDAIIRLAALSEREYEQCRSSEAKRLTVRASMLDKMVQAEKKAQQKNDGDFNDVEPWPDPVPGDALLSGIADTISRFIVCSPETAQAAALWAVMTWFMDTVQVAPLAVITAPEKRCGKSQLLAVLGRLSCRPMAAGNITPAALFRTIDAWRPTLLIDEADAFMRDNEELRGLLNSGHTRESAYTIRVVGEEFTPKRFNTWGAKAIAGIGKLADTLMDRAITLELRRKLPYEKSDRLRYAEPRLFDDLVSQIARFAEDNRDAVRCARPDLPQALHDRAQDNWEPLLAIADVAGGVWPVLAREAALVLSGVDEAHGTGIELLEDIREIFERKNLDRISTGGLIEALCADEEKGWATYNRGKPITSRQVAKRLKDYGVHSKTIRVLGSGTPKGYERKDFDDAFDRYTLTPFSPVLSATPQQSINHAGYSVADRPNAYATKNLYPQHATNLPDGCAKTDVCREVI